MKRIITTVSCLCKIHSYFIIDRNPINARILPPDDIQDKLTMAINGRVPMVMRPDMLILFR